VAITKMELMELVRNAEGGDVDFLREGVRVLAQALDAERVGSADTFERVEVGLEVAREALTAEGQAN
jgi:hypothetical protein